MLLIKYNLSKKPLQIDLLVIEKLKDVQIQNEIGKLFKRHNQIVATGELKVEEHLILRVLSKNAEEADIREFVRYVNDFTEPGEKQNMDAVLQVSVSANKTTYEQIRRNMTMCEALRELMKDEIDAEVEAARREAVREGREEGRAEGREEGRAEGENRLKELCEQLDRDGRRDEFFQAMKNTEILKKLYKEYGIA